MLSLMPPTQPQHDLERLGIYGVAMPLSVCPLTSPIVPPPAPRNEITIF